MKIRRFSLSKNKLLKMHETERTFLLLAGHMHNEFSSLQKVFAWCLAELPSQPNSSIENLTNGSQAMIYARLLAGKLLEGWNVLGQAYFGSKLSHQLDDEMHHHALECLSKIKNYFSKQNIIFSVRNSFSFHYEASEVCRTWEAAADEPGFEFLVGHVFSGVRTRSQSGSVEFD